MQVTYRLHLKTTRDRLIVLGRAVKGLFTGRMLVTVEVVDKSKPQPDDRAEKLFESAEYQQFVEAENSVWKSFNKLMRKGRYE